MNPFHSGRAPIRIDPTKPFISDVDITAEVRKALRLNANMECPQCRGEGTYQAGTGEKKLCRCVRL